MDEQTPTIGAPPQESLADSSRVISAAARLRSWSAQFGWPAWLFLLVAPTRPEASYELSSYFFVALPIGLCAMAIRLWACGYPRENFFVISGPYRYVRNPVEMGAVLAYLAAGIALGLELWSLIVLVFLAVLYISFTAIAYERDLVRLYGSVYLRYKKRVRRWLPLSLPATNPSNQDYTLQRACFYEWRAAVWFAGYVVIYAIRQNF